MNLSIYDHCSEDNLFSEQNVMKRKKERLDQFCLPILMNVYIVHVWK